MDKGLVEQEMYFDQRLESMSNMGVDIDNPEKTFKELNATNKRLPLIIKNLMQDPDIKRDAAIGVKQLITQIRKKLIKIYNAKWWLHDKLYDYEFMPMWLEDLERREGWKGGYRDPLKYK